MGEITDDIVEGACCQLCGCYFDGGPKRIYSHRYPVVCWDCWTDLSKKERRDYVRAQVKTI